MLSTAFLWHDYGHSPIGSRSDIERVPIDRLQAFYRRYYQPDNAVLVVAGKFDPRKRWSWIKELWSDPKPDPQARPALYGRARAGRRARSGLAPRGRRADLDRWPITGPRARTRIRCRCRCSWAMLVDPPSGRLYKALVESKKAISVEGEA